MYNTDLPTRAELPSSKQLLTSTLAAAGIAAALLITTILPAEYGVDPTGVGRVLGLTQMGEIKVSLAQEAAAEEAPKVAAQPAPQTSAQAPAQPTTPQTAIQAAPEAAPVSPVAVAQAPAEKPTTAEPAATTQRHERQFTLKPGAAIEVKLAMRKDAQVNYRWSVEGGTLNFDTHGDNASTSYHGYSKGRYVAGDQGVLTAAFDGHHGWFWRNRSKGDVTLTLQTEGEYTSIKRVL